MPVAARRRAVPSRNRSSGAPGPRDRHDVALPRLADVDQHDSRSPLSRAASMRQLGRRHLRERGRGGAIAGAPPPPGAPTDAPGIPQNSLVVDERGDGRRLAAHGAVRGRRARAARPTSGAARRARAAARRAAPPCPSNELHRLGRPAPTRSPRRARRAPRPRRTTARRPAAAGAGTRSGSRARARPPHRHLAVEAVDRAPHVRQPEAARTRR